ncbi:hypothetical protein F511_02869 [Dorcoceras hygrometricum]|uniref:Uncharacterized protein n=1 Tax=Dorcoceras hygrometricum TaxID=472368 RepID=A0A2Z7AIV3_9LAMI|nr:hypothetical protein F511_02869 [Dorcoceras hygrometricum]
MAVVSKTRNMLEGLVKDGSFKWLSRTRSLFDEEIEELRRSPSAGNGWLQELSPPANVVIHRCSKILGLSTCQLRENFDVEASDSIKHDSNFARNFLEYCCFLALSCSIQVINFLDDKNFRRLIFDMMISWEFPAASSQPFPSLDDDATVGIEAFSRISPAVPIICNVIVADKIFEVLSDSTSSRLHFSTFNKYLIRLERVIRKFQSQSESSLLSSQRLGRGEKVLEVDGTTASQPVIEHVGRLTLTDHALYFEDHRVVSYDKAKMYDLADELQQIIRSELSGPWGTRLFDTAVFYKSNSLLEPVVMEFPELKGHTRRDYWLAIIREVLYVHKFIRKFHLSGLERDEVLLKAIFGILRVQALKEISSTIPICCETLLMFNVCDKLPCGDLILESVANMLTMREIDRGSATMSVNGMYSISGLALASKLGVAFGTSSCNAYANTLVVGEIAVGDQTPLEKAVKKARSSYENVILAQATVDGVKVGGIDTNLAVMKELLSPITHVWNWILLLLYWEDPWKSLAFCLVSTYILFKGWLGHALASFLFFLALFMLLNRCVQGGPIDELKVMAPPAMNAMEQLLGVQTAVSQAENLIQEANILLLKYRALLLSLFPQATERCAVVLLVIALVLAFVPVKYIFVVAFLELFTRYSPLRRANTERFQRRLRDWWFSIPAAPVALERYNDDKKKR